jgi:hypothetical protein
VKFGPKILAQMTVRQIKDPGIAKIHIDVTILIPSLEVADYSKRYVCRVMDSLAFDGANIITCWVIMRVFWSVV